MGKFFQTQKSKFEIDEAISNGDYTGGYNFISWVYHMRKFFIVALVFDLFAGYKLAQAYPEYGYELPTLLAALFFGLMVPVIIVVLLLHEFKNLKKGISQ